MMYWRNIWRNPRRTFVILTAVFIGVSGMTFLAAMMKGMVYSMVENSVNNLTGHMLVRGADFITDPSVENRIRNADKLLKEITGVIPPDGKIVKRIKLEAVANTARDSYGVTVVGCDLGAEVGVSFIGSAEIDGKKPENSGVLIGRSLSEKSGIGLGKRLVLNMQDEKGELISRSFKVEGVFKAGQKQQEDSYIFMPLAQLENMLGVAGCATELSIILPEKNIENVYFKEVEVNISNVLPSGVTLMNWREIMPAISAYLDVFDSFILIWYLVVFIAMGFGIVNTVLMAVYERMREFGLMRALGVRIIGIFYMVIAETSLIMLIGILTGNTAAYALTAYFASVGIDLSAFASGTDMFAISRVIYPVFSFKDFLEADVTVFILGLLVAVYPAVKACGFTPVETMRER